MTLGDTKKHNFLTYSLIYYFFYVLVSPKRNKNSIIQLLSGLTLTCPYLFIFIFELLY